MAELIWLRFTYLGKPLIVHDRDRALTVASEQAVLARVILPADVVGDNPLDELEGLATTAGARIVGGMLFVNSGYGSLGFMPGNVVLAFSIDGK